MPNKISVRSVAEGLSLAPTLGYPLAVTAAYVLGGWRKVAQDEHELLSLIEEGLRHSPVGEVCLQPVRPENASASPFGPP